MMGIGVARNGDVWIADGADHQLLMALCSVDAIDNCPSDLQRKQPDCCHRTNLMNSSAPESALLAGLGDNTVQTLVAAAQVRRLGPNEMLIAEGQPANHLFLIGKGTLDFTG